jgi:hypothetical protein
MESMKVTALIQALELIGRIYRSKDGSRPAEAVRKVLQQFDGAADMTLAEWIEARQPKPSLAPRRAAKAGHDAERIDGALRRLDQASSQAALTATAAALDLTAGEWRALVRKLIGKSARSGKAAREMAEAHFSDRLLLQERLKGVKRLFA